MNWNDIRQHVGTIFGNLYSRADGYTREQFQADVEQVFVDDGDELDEQDIEFAKRYAGELYDKYAD